MGFHVIVGNTFFYKPFKLMFSFQLFHLKKLPLILVMAYILCFMHKPLVLNVLLSTSKIRYWLKTYLCHNNYFLSVLYFVCFSFQSMSFNKYYIILRVKVK